MATATGVISRARSKIGVTENPRGSNLQEFGQRYGFNGVPWCSIFVWDTFNADGVDLKKSVSRGYADCDTALAGFARNGWVLANKRDARPGDIVFYDMSTKDGAGADHTGVVEAVTSGGVTAIEGNTSLAGHQTNGGAVCRKMRSWSLVKAVARVPFSASQPQPPPQVPGALMDHVAVRVIDPTNSQTWACTVTTKRLMIDENDVKLCTFCGWMPPAAIQLSKQPEFTRWFNSLEQVGRTDV